MFKVVVRYSDGREEELDMLCETVAGATHYGGFMSRRLLKSDKANLLDPASGDKDAGYFIIEVNGLGKEL